jgi:tripartite-type tricarboxylate transporter receptor subunit TctC
MGKLLLSLLAVSSVASFCVEAQQFPTRPVRIIVGITAGTGPDNIARRVGEKFSERLGQPAVVENRPGLVGHLAAEMVGRSPADGYTLLMTTSGVTMTATLYASSFPNFNAMTDLAPIAIAATGPSSMIASNKTPFTTFAEVIAYAKANPGKLTFGTPGVGHAFHFLLEYMQEQTGARFLHVPYKGTAPGMADLVAGHVDLMFLSTHTIMPYVTRGQVKGIVSASENRHRNAPAMPSFGEIGMRVPSIAEGWFGFLAPAKVPQPLQERLSAEIRAILNMPDVKAALEKTGLDVNPRPPDQMREIMKVEFADYAIAIKKYNIKPE